MMCRKVKLRLPALWEVSFRFGLTDTEVMLFSFMVVMHYEKHNEALEYAPAFYAREIGYLARHLKMLKWGNIRACDQASHAACKALKKVGWIEHEPGFIHTKKNLKTLRLTSSGARMAKKLFDIPCLSEQRS